MWDPEKSAYCRLGFLRLLLQLMRNKMKVAVSSQLITAFLIRLRHLC